MQSNNMEDYKHPNLDLYRLHRENLDGNKYIPILEDKKHPNLDAKNTFHLWKTMNIQIWMCTYLFQ